MSSERSSRHSNVSSSSSRSSRNDKAFNEKLQTSDLFAEVRFLEEKQTTEFKEQKLEVEEQYAKTRARVKVLEDLEGDSVNPTILCNPKINIA